MTRCSPRLYMWLILAVSLSSSLCSAGEPGEPDQKLIEPPKLLAGVQRALAAPYLSLDEAADKRVFHGVWEPGDLDDPSRRARAALMLGAYDDPSLSDPIVPIEDRAEASVARGEFDEALTLLDEVETVRGARLRAAALMGLGRYDDADKAIEPIVRTLLDRPLTTAPELVEAARAMGLRARLEGRSAQDYRDIMGLLARAQEELDRLYWPAILAQAQLLADKDNREEAGKALPQVLAMNPRSARAWYRLGMLAVGGFSFDKSEKMAARLDHDLAEFQLGDDQSDEASHPWAALIRARAALRQNLGDEALELLAPVLERYPLMREPLAVSIAATALTYDEKLLGERLAAFDQLSPGSAQAVFEVGKALAEARQYDVARGYLVQATQREPNWARPWIELGLLAMQSGRDAEAADALARAGELDPFNIRARNSRTLIDKLVMFDSIKTDGFVIRYKPGIDVVLAREMVEPLKSIHEDVTGEFKFDPPTDTVIELMPDHQWFGVRITGMPQIHTIAASTGPVIAMEAPRFGKKGLYSGPYDWARVVRHEYVHTVTLGRTHNRIPHWFTEAAAVHMESPYRDYGTTQLLVRALTEDFLHPFDKINIAFTRPKHDYDRPLAYAQGHWMYEYILYRWGSDAPIAMMDLYAQGVREGEAMQQVLGVSQEQFFDDFKQWARKDAASWGMIPERTVEQMLLELTLENPERRQGLEDALSNAGIDLALAMAGGALPGEVKLDLLDLTPARLDVLLERFPEHPDLLQAQIERRLAESGDKPTPAMIPLLERYALARPVDPMPHRHLARLYLDSDTPDKAIEHLEYLDGREQKTPAYAIELARRFAASGRWDEAWTSITRAVQIAPYDPDNRELAATVALRRGDLASAERHILALTVLEPKQEVHRKRLEAVRKMRGRNDG